MTTLYRAIPALTPEQIERFWSKIDKNGPVPAHRPDLGPCHLWTAGCTPQGYGAFKVGDSNYAAHRVAWTLVNGPISADLLACHHCDNPPCCNLAHLFEGTQADNIADCVRKGRAAHVERHSSVTRPECRPRGDRHPARIHPERLACGDQHYSRLHPERLSRGDQHPARTHPERLARGEANGSAILNSSDVRAIRQRRALKEKVIALAREYGVSTTTIKNICNGTAWGHVI